jgi:DNA-directed RNA polymerase subunit RPC12/RpoP
MPTVEKEYICSVCGHEQDSMDRKCDECGTFRVVLKHIIVDTVGPEWRVTCFPQDKYPRAWEQPGWKESLIP